MSGECEEDTEEEKCCANEWMWAHVLWQKRGLRMEEFAEMPRNIQLAYIASEQLVTDNPLHSTDRLAKVYIKKK